MMTETLLVKFHLWLDELLIGGISTEEEQQRELRAFFSGIERVDRELLVGLAGMRWSARKLQLLSGALFSPRYRRALLAGIGKRIERGVSGGEAEEIAGLLSSLSWPALYAASIRQLAGELKERAVQPA